VRLAAASAACRLCGHCARRTALPEPGQPERDSTHAFHRTAEQPVKCGPSYRQGGGVPSGVSGGTWATPECLGPTATVRLTDALLRAGFTEPNPCRQQCRCWSTRPPRLLSTSRSCGGPRVKPIGVRGMICGAEARAFADDMSLAVRGARKTRKRAHV
jgi:hypothetical protein